MIDGEKTTRALTIVQAHPNGVTSLAVSFLLSELGCSQATAAGMLARLYWRGLVDRRKVGMAFVYTPRPAKDRPKDQPTA